MKDGLSSPHTCSGTPELKFSVGLLDLVVDGSHDTWWYLDADGSHDTWPTFGPAKHCTLACGRPRTRSTSAQRALVSILYIFLSPSGGLGPCSGHPSGTGPAAALRHLYWRFAPFGLVRRAFLNKVYLKKRGKKVVNTFFTARGVLNTGHVF